MHSCSDLQEDIENGSVASDDIVPYREVLTHGDQFPPEQFWGKKN